ncbi:MAG: hypothetical protein HRT88_20175 [Lentisphaeraceae bacterium]|nr:hypothetical protein [Lentisphaeraceae bacterium]
MEVEEQGLLQVFASSIKKVETLSDCLESFLFREGYKTYVSSFQRDEEHFAEFMSFMRPLLSISEKSTHTFSLSNLELSLDNCIKEIRYEKHRGTDCELFLLRLQRVKETAALFQGLRVSLSFFKHPEPRKQPNFQANAVIFVSLYAHLMEEAIGESKEES